MSLETPDGVIPRSLAAAANPPRSMTRTNARRSVTSLIPDPKSPILFPVAGLYAGVRRILSAGTAMKADRCVEVRRDIMKRALSRCRLALAFLTMHASSTWAQDGVNTEIAPNGSCEVRSSA